MSMSLTDSFEGRVTDNWKLDPGWIVKQENGDYNLSGEGHSWARLRGGEDWTDYSFLCRIKLDNGVIHLNYRVSEEGRYFIGFRENGLYLKKEAPLGEFIDLATSESHHESKTWHDIEIIGEEGHLQVYVDKTLEINFTDTAPLTRGSIAFEILENSNAYVDEVTIKQLGAPSREIWLKINSFDELIRHEEEIIERIANVPNGGNLFMAHPFMLLADIGVELSEQAKEEIISIEPHLTTLSPEPYNAIKRSKEEQTIQFHLRGLFRRRSE